jgi:hypothetical protein
MNTAAYITLTVILATALYFGIRWLIQSLLQISRRQGSRLSGNMEDRSSGS